MANLTVKINKLKLNNPVMVASGTFGYGQELEGLIDLSCLGAIVTKTITLSPRSGNPMPRTIETPSGLLNSIGLQNKGVEDFLEDKIPFLKNVPTKVIVSIAGESIQEYKKLTKILDEQDAVDAIEINISCPNIKSQVTSRRSQAAKLKHAACNQLIAQDPKATYQVVKAVKTSTNKTVITKLSPNVTDIVQIAQAAKQAGTDALSLINTVYGMSINVEKKRPHLASVFGGLSGPAIKPIALSMVYQVAKKIRLPIIGMGGIMNTQDALEFILAGAAAIAVGTGNYVNPHASVEIVKGLKKYLIQHNIKDIKELVGGLKI